MKVIGVGFGRTGSLSLKKALEILGFGPCYHMQVTFFHPWHIPFWYKASINKNMQWKKFFKKYNSTVDWPASAFYQDLIREYPEAKFILHIREPESWYNSAHRTIYTMSKSFPFWFPRKLKKMQDNIIWQGIFEGEFENRQKALDKFNSHIKDIKKSIPENKLLIFNVKDGWQPLCDFLDKPLPQDEPFPYRNEAKKYILLIKFVKFAEWAVPISVILISLYMLFFIF